jgi:hypothetical protein
MNTVVQGVAAAAGAGVTIIVTNMVGKLLTQQGKTLAPATKNFVSLGVGLALSLVAPKLKLGKYADAAITGAIAISIINIMATSFGLGQYFTLAGDSNPELDKIIANLDVSGASAYQEQIEGDMNTLLGVSEISGISEMSGFIPADQDEDNY